MSKRVKPRRRYRSVLRERQAAATREAILDATLTQLERRGYAETRLRDVADAAGVSVETIHAIFGSKGRLLMALGERNLQRGLQAEIPGGEMLALIAEPDLDRQLAHFGAVAPAIMGPNWPIMDGMRLASAADPELAAGYRAGSDGRRGWMRAFADAWAARGLLRDGLDAAAAADVLWALTSPDLYRLLVVETGWAPDRYANWVSASARSLVLA
jgi:TetR/AcrR family transcriptional regulator, regulator of autoinduction and epiphytic fitness